MRFVNRVDKPKSLKKKGPGLKEKRKAIAFYEKGIGKKPVFKAYKSDDVKEALRDMFHEKCAFCESSIPKVSDSHIEHFRPKGMITTFHAKNITPGYYWLASEWSNLLLACARCNSPHSETLKDSTKYSYGKKNHFPLYNTSNSKRHQGIKREENVRLLINPTIDNPKNYLSFHILNGTISPKQNGNFQELRAQKSIYILGLNRKELAEFRKKVCSDFWIKIANIIDIASDDNIQPGAMRALDREIKAINNMLSNEKTEHLGLIEELVQKAQPMIDTL